MIDEILDKISEATDRGLTREVVLESRTNQKPLSKYPYSALPPFFAEGERPEDNERVVFSIQTWNGRNVMSLEVKD
jgi:hypothetical protein